MLSTPRTIINILLSLVFFMVALPALFLLPAEIILFQAGPYIKGLADQNVYERIPELVAELVFDQEGMFITDGYEKRAIENLNQSHYQQIIEVLMTEEWIGSQSDSLVTQLWDFLNFKTATLSLKVDLRQIKSRLVGEESSNVSNIIVSTWPPCELGDALQFGSLILSGDINQVPICQPPVITMPLALAMVQTFLPVYCSKIPDEMDLVHFLVISQDDLPQLKTAFAVYRMLRFCWYLTPLVSILLLGLIGFVARTSKWKALNWVGLQLIQVGIAGILTAAILLFANFYVANSIVDKMPVSKISILMTSITNVMTGVTNQFALFGGVISISVTIAGVIAVTMAILRLHNRQD